MLDNKKYTINKLEDGKLILLMPITEVELKRLEVDMAGIRTTQDMNVFYSNYGIRYQDILLYGESDILSKSENNRMEIDAELKKILPTPVSVKNAITNRIEPSYKCFCSKGKNVSDITSHKTAISSWLCLMTRLYKPKYVLVYKQEPDKDDK